MTDGPEYPRYPGEQPVEPSQPTMPPPPGYGGPPPGYQPPPAPGYPPMGYPTHPGSQTPHSHAGWGSRVGAYLLDILFAVCAFLPLLIVGGVIMGLTATATTGLNGETIYEDASPLGYVFIGLGYVAYVGFIVWNFVIRQGNTGQSYGKSIVGLRVVRENGDPRLGKGLALGRLFLLGVLSTFTCYLNLLWPLWDSKKQTLHDKVVSTVVVRA